MNESLVAAKKSVEINNEISSACLEQSNGISQISSQAEIMNGAVNVLNEVVYGNVTTSEAKPERRTLKS